VNRRRGLASGMAAVILLPLLSACVLTQDRLDSALEVPRAYRAAHGPPNAPPPLDWWQTFRSAELTDLVQQANAANFSIAAAVARIVEADAQARIAGAALLPMLNVTANVQKSQISTAVGGGRLSAARGRGITTTYTTALNASYTVDLGTQQSISAGRRFYGRRQAV
jgi:outer membrane protein, multidrug efflux system